MKTNILTTAFACFGLAILPLHAEDGARSKASHATSGDAVQKTITTYIIHVNGSGWGISRRVSSALKTQEGIQKILMSGLRATVIMKDGKELDKEKTSKVLIEKGLPAKTFKKTETPIPAEVYQLAVAGTGWATSSDKVRVALEKLDGISAAYVNNGIMLHMTAKDTFNKETITEVLKPFKITIKESTQIKGSPFADSAVKS